MKIIPINKTGLAKRGLLKASFALIIATVGEPNVTDMDDSSKVAASWGFADENGREAFIWSWHVSKGDLATNLDWSVDGSMELLMELFPDIPQLKG